MVTKSYIIQSTRKNILSSSASFADLNFLSLNLCTKWNILLGDQNILKYVGSNEGFRRPKGKLAFTADVMKDRPKVN